MKIDKIQQLRTGYARTGCCGLMMKIDKIQRRWRAEQRNESCGLMMKIDKIQPTRPFPFR